MGSSPLLCSYRGGNRIEAGDRQSDMSRATVNRYAAIVLLLTAIVSAVALKLSLSSYAPEANLQVANELQLGHANGISTADVTIYRYL